MVILLLLAAQGPALSFRLGIAIRRQFEPSFVWACHRGSPDALAHASFACFAGPFTARAEEVDQPRRFLSGSGPGSVRRPEPLVSNYAGSPVIRLLMLFAT